MKKRFLTLLAVLTLGLAAQAQEVVTQEVVAIGYSQPQSSTFGFSQGDVFVEGSLGYSTTDNKAAQEKGHTFNLTPQVGYFLSDKFAAGVYFDLRTQKDDNYGGPKDITKTNNFSVGVFGRYYFLEAGQRFKFYGQANVGYAHAKLTYEDNFGKYDSKGSGVNAGLDLGVNYFVTKKIAVNFAFANVVDFNSAKPKGGKSTNDLTVNVNNFNNFFDTPTFGLTFVL